MRSLRGLVSVERHGRGAVKVVGSPVAVAEAYPAGIASKVEVYRLQLDKRGYYVEAHCGDDGKCGVCLNDDSDRRTIVWFKLDGFNVECASVTKYTLSVCLIKTPE